MGHPLLALERLHVEVDREVAVLERPLKLACGRGCSSCCVDEISVFEIEAERIKAEHASLLAHARPHPVGACAFLDADGLCRIYDSRPYVCRTQGLPLRWFEESEGRTTELRDICPLNESDETPVESIPADRCWTIGPYEARLARLQIDIGGYPPRRVRLRDLFSSVA